MVTQRPSRLYVVLDGLATRSEKAPDEFGSPPWLGVLLPDLRRRDPDAAACGFSYLGPGRHYGPIDTTASLALPAALLRAHYAPVSNLPTVYIAFSIGSLVAILGLSELFEMEGPALADNVEALVLVQPALMLPASAKEYRGECTPISELYRRATSDDSASGFALTDEILGKLNTLCRCIPVHVLYWPGDPIVDYGIPPAGSATLVEMLRHEAGVSVEEPLDGISLDVERRRHPVAEHCAVASDPRTVTRLIALLDRVLPRR